MASHPLHFRLERVCLGIPKRDFRRASGTGFVINDDGLQTIAFGPDFNTVGAPTYHKMYVSGAEMGATAVRPQ